MTGLSGRAWQENWAGRRRRLVSELRGLPRPAAVFAYNDCLAADVIDACRDSDLRVPEEIAVLGVDNDPDGCDCAPVPLSSVRHDLEGMAYEAAAASGFSGPAQFHRAFRRISGTTPRRYRARQRPTTGSP